MFRPLVIVAVILGAVIFKHFDLKTWTLKDPVMDTLYIIVFVVVLFFLFRGKK